MAEPITTNGHRQRLAAFFKNGTGLSVISKMAFGDGGYAGESVIEPDPAQTALNSELMRKNLSLVLQDDAYSVTGTGVILKAELNGQSISEAGLLDADGNLVGFKNFAPKIKESDEEYEIKIKLKF
ncbi:phage tail protein [Desulfobacter hydrogenophilus]|uniref:Phage tail protein n=1 Tax=Desulfobacter hydrogenophilus TaxID=2291 RepID=A0A328F9L4_9BACT|nr:phage tail protein [Desulfobacter hydrogenophilus]NDY73993.1 phage tail protein [Desulfobacter hydrogenophilus]QBH14338.1 phage tail protein [Desulfobacter hydrogenophilus]RAM00340.1 phage tail protein [Desulfobacter hydrogenophilus]